MANKSWINTPLSIHISLTRGRTRFRSVVIYFGSRMFFFPMAPSQAKSERRARWTACKDAAGRQTRRVTSDHVAHYRRGVFRSMSVPNVFYSDVLSFRSIYRIHLQIFGRMTNVLSIDSVLISRVVASLRERGNRAAANAVRYLHFWRRTAY